MLSNEGGATEDVAWVINGGVGGVLVVGIIAAIVIFTSGGSALCASGKYMSDGVC